MWKFIKKIYLSLIEKFINIFIAVEFMNYLYLKRLIDISLSIIFLIFLCPVLLFISIILFINNKGNPFFIQRRPGKDEKLFGLIKFKTMNDLRDSKNILLPDELRLTKIGRIIRRSSLDEIPQLINVLVGDMSLIGPRPLLEEYLPLYDENQKRRHILRPGITGWAQVNGRNAINWKEKFEYDVWYVDNLSLRLDIKIFFRTISNVIKAKGISSYNSVTMDKFKGN